jgi:NADH:ubiquinone oxidoreductase subunit
MVPAEWFGWLHYKTDLPPTISPPPTYKWIEPHRENLTGTPEQYVPYTTTVPKIQSWVPPKKK